jgi:hypothetical protein
MRLRTQDDIGQLVALLRPGAADVQSTVPSATVLTSDERGRIGEIGALAIFVHLEEAPDDPTRAIRAAARARPARAVEGIEPIVDRDLLSRTDLLPREYLHPAAHRVRVARVVEVAPRRQHDGEAVPTELREVHPILRGQRGDLSGTHDSAVPPAKDELAAGEVPYRKDALPLRSRLFDRHVRDQCQ